MQPTPNFQDRDYAVVVQPYANTCSSTCLRKIQEIASHIEALYVHRSCFCNFPNIYLGVERQLISYKIGRIWGQGFRDYTITLLLTMQWWPEAESCKHMHPLFCSLTFLLYASTVCYCQCFLATVLLLSLQKSHQKVNFIQFFPQQFFLILRV